MASTFRSCNAVVLGTWILAPCATTESRAQVNLLAHDGLSHTAFTIKTNWSDRLVPSSGKDYVAAFNIRTPTDANAYTFGDQSFIINSTITGSVDPKHQ